MIYHKFSHGDVSYRFNGGNINIFKFKLIFKWRLLIWRNRKDSNVKTDFNGNKSDKVKNDINTPIVFGSV